MDLHEYPRPKNDTGIGVHWNAGYASAIGLGQVEQIWLPRLRDMGVKWVKISQHDGAMGFTELLLKNEIMPIVRIYRPQPNPGILGNKELAAVRDYVAAGARYLEFNNEPDLGVEWQGGEYPLNGAQIVARNAIIDMEAILQRGGYPAIPALRPGGRWDLVGEICRLGRRDLLSQPVWQALHNYSANHPLDYPYDRVNQEGAPCSREFFDKLNLEKWNGDTWEGWTLEQVNQFRKERANPGATAFGDPTCWRAYERYDQLIRNQIGRSLPILATENGFVVGERQDKRYPHTTPQLHAVQTLEACRIMMGTSGLYDHAPDYYFCTAYWLIGNFTLGSWAPAWECAAWFSQDWPGNQLPIVAALMAEPKRARTWRGDAGLPGRVFGVIRNGPKLPLTLRLVRADGWLAIVQAGADGSYEFSDLPLDRFVLTIVEAGVSQEIALSRERPAATASFDLKAATIRLASSIIRGQVQGGAGKVMLLTRQSGNAWEEQQLVGPDSTYRFVELEPGTYMLKLTDTTVAKAGIALDGLNEVVIDLAMPGWGWQASDGGNSPGFGVVRCRVIGRPNLAVRLWTDGWSGMTQRTGTKPEYGPDVCEFAPLGAGPYKVQPEGVSVVAAITADGSRVRWVTFTENTTAPVQASRISGHVRNGPQCRLKLSGAGVEQTTIAAEDGAYAFADLPAGTYRVTIDGTNVFREEIVLDGQNAVTVDLEAPIAVTGAIFGVVANGADRTLRLWLPPTPAPLAETRADAEGRYRFDKLAAGSYTVQVLGDDPAAGPAAQQPGVMVDGVNAVKVDFAVGPVPVGVWTAKVEDGGHLPGFCVVRCQVAGEVDREVRLWTAGWGGMILRTGSKQEYGADVCEFAPLGPGRYSVEPVGLDAGAGQSLRTDITLDPNRLLWVRFCKTASQPIELPRRSVIAGSVTHGEGRQARLTWIGGQQVVVVSGGRYRFESLAAGVYRVAISAADIAAGEVVAREGLTVDGTNEIAVDFALPEPIHADSIISGRIKGGGGRTVRLAGPDVNRTTVVAADETYHFGGLPAGDYTLTVLDSDPPTGTSQTQSDIQVTGVNTVQIDVDLTSIGPAKTVEHCLLPGSIARTKDDFVTTLQYISRFQPVVTTDDTEARKARHVTILGGVSGISALVEQGLRMAGCQVQRVEGDYATALGKLLAENRPY